MNSACKTNDDKFHRKNSLVHLLNGPHQIELIIIITIFMIKSNYQ